MVARNANSAATAQPVRVAARANYRPIPYLLKPQKRSMAEAVPAALHIAGAVTLCIAVFAAINIAVTETLGPRNPWTKLVQSGVLMAMVTATILATPNLGTSVTKGIARIIGVFVGGWLFFGLYAANQSWWFLSICLAVFAFVLVALSHVATARHMLSPVALVTAFIVACSFNSVKQALVMTTVKTVAISGSIFLYTALAMLLFPASATQQLLSNLAIALDELHQLAEIVLTKGEQRMSANAAAADAAEAAAAAAGVGTGGAAAAAADPEAPTPAAALAKAGKRGKQVQSAAVAAACSAAAGLTADIGHRLQLVQDLLPSSMKERYVGSCGAYRCFVPSVRRVGIAREAEVLAVVLSASQVLRVLVTMLAEFGNSPMAHRKPPTTIRLTGPKQELVVPLAQQAVDALQDISAALPRLGRAQASVLVASIHGFSDTLQELLDATVEAQQAADGASAATAAAAAAGSAGRAGAAAAAHQAAPVAAAANRWQAAAAAAGARLPGCRAQHLAAAFGALLTDAVSSEQAQTARWCAFLVMARQTGRAIAGLNDSVNQLLPRLPWTAAQQQVAS